MPVQLTAPYNYFRRTNYTFHDFQRNDYFLVTRYVTAKIPLPLPSPSYPPNIPGIYKIEEFLRSKCHRFDYREKITLNYFINQFY